MSDTRPPVTTWVTTETERAEREVKAKIKETIDGMCNQLEKEGVHEIERLLFRGVLEGLDPLDLYRAEAIFWTTRQNLKIRQRKTLCLYIGGTSLIALFMPQYFVAVACIWVITVWNFFTGFTTAKQIVRHVIQGLIMFFGTGAILLHAAYNLLFG